MHLRTREVVNTKIRIIGRAIIGRAKSNVFESDKATQTRTVLGGCVYSNTSHRAEEHTQHTILVVRKTCSNEMQRKTFK